MASGLSTPVGFKNATNGSLDVAINALQSASRPHSFLGINGNGQSAVVRTSGNPYGHVVLRGGAEGSELRYCHHRPLRAGACQKQAVLQHRGGLQPCQRPQRSALQPLVLNDCAHQILEGNRSIVGFMIESNLEWGNQAIPADRSQLKYGVSITNACVDWATTEKMLRETRAKLKTVLPARFAERE